MSSQDGHRSISIPMTGWWGRRAKSAGSSPKAGTMAYRREIDGLRAIAVLPVIFFHAGFEIFSGGYIGVDVFFVISGYLITTIIINEKDAGTFSLIRFYERRARRILPALFLVMLVCLPFAWSWMFLQERKDFAQSLVAVSVYASNFLFWVETDYFGGTAELKPLLHTWSLAVEEQYYVFFPLFLVLTWSLGKARVNFLLVLIGLASLAIAQWWTLTNPSAAFYLLPSRLWELLVGSLVAFYLVARPLGQTTDGLKAWQDQILSAVGLLLILYAIFAFSKNTPFPGLYAVIPTLGTALIILHATPHTLCGRILCNPLFVGVGLISYSAYLWHQPLFAFARLRLIDEPSEPLRLFLGVAALGLAYLSWRFVERPFRDRKRISRKTIFTSAVACTVFFCGLGFLGQVTNGYSFVKTSDGTSLAELSHRVRVNQGFGPSCVNTFTEAPECRSHPEPDIVVWGDSFAMHLVPGILASNPEAKVVQMTISACGPVISLSPFSRKFTRSEAQECIDFNDQVMDWIAQSETIRYVVLASPFKQFYEGDREVLTGAGEVAQGPEVILDHLRATLEQFGKPGRHPGDLCPTADQPQRHRHLLGEIASPRPRPGRLQH